MINSYSVARSHTAGAGAGTAAAAATGGTAITLHFNYNNNNKSNNINSNNNSGLKPMATATNEHKSHHNKNIITTKTIAATTTANMLKITQNEAETKHFRMTYPLEQQQQQSLKGADWMGVNWTVPGISSFVNTSASTKEPQFTQVQSSSSSNNNKQQVQSTTTTAIAKCAFIEVMQQQQQQQRTEDQENAFRQIEDVHNYAKLQHQQHHHHPHHNHHRQRHHRGNSKQQHSHDISSDELGEDDDDDDEDDDDNEEEEDVDGVGEELQTVNVIATKQKKKSYANVPINNNNTTKIIINNNDDSEEHLEVDVVTVTPTTTTAAAVAAAQQQEHVHEQEPLLSPTVEADMLRPEHHARRPMNAFLIFCKRHRAIVKERYKSLENRAITKILGDWWAALDDQEKQCFTDLAQQNKDAFFNANPNFKWYKLPAPPLRTLATRPSNAIALATHASDEQQSQQQQQPQQQQQQQQLHWQQHDVAQMLRCNYFKFADETQMGHLSVLLSENVAGVQDKDFALQQALSETTQFLSVHMPNSNNNNKCSGNKRGLQQIADYSASNSSEEEERGLPGKKAKSSRSCKGKIYQELINSGQLAAIAKKSKCRLNSDSNSSSSNNNTPPISPTTAATASATTASGATSTATADCQQQLMQLEVTTTTRDNNNSATTVANRRNNNCDAIEFDLEEKIKELPALSLDAYLQRKRSTKKKKKFTSNKKQRNSNSSSSNHNSATATPTVAANEQQQKPNNKSTRNKCNTELTATTVAAAATTTTATLAVGSQKRKARKESITRRDVSAIEQEVASILPLTINGCYYFNQLQQLPARSQQQQQQHQQQPPTVVVAADSSNASTYDVTSSTSDLLILAEVAANRTELTKSN